MPSITDFLLGLGVNTHMDATTSPYGNVALVQQSLAYLGVSLIRDHAYDTELTAYETLAAGDNRLSLIFDDDVQAEIDALLPVAGSFNALEGANEVDYQPILTNGIADPVLAAVAQQKSLYLAARATAATSALPVIDDSLADPANFAAFTGTRAYTDVANLHAYAPYGAAPGQTLLSTLEAAAVPAGMRVVITETGYYSLPNLLDPSGVDESVQARYTLDTLFDAAKLGVAETFLYELLDEASDPLGLDPELHYGLFHADGTPKPVAAALHNLTAILAAGETASHNAPPAIAPDTSGLPDTGNALLLTGTTGAEFAVFWNEPAIWNPLTQQEITPASAQVTLDLGTAVALVEVFDPLLGTAPIATYADAASVTITLTDHPILIELITPDAAPTPPVTTDPTPTSPAAPATPDPVGGGTTAGTSTPATIGVYRFFDTNTGTQFLTASAAEAQAIAQSRPDYVAEGIGLHAVDPADADAAPVFRFFDTRNGTHFFTASASERDTIVATRPDLIAESGSLFYERTTPQTGDVAVYRFFDATYGTHFYTDSAAERASILATRPDLVAEGIAFYAPAA